MESASNKFAIKYHDIFGYPLTSEELKKWKFGLKFSISNFRFSINKKQNFYFINGNQKTIEQRLQNEKYSKNKLKLAKSVANLISKISTIKFVGITGSLAMMNASKNSDIDLLIITEANTLWMTRLLSYMAIWLNGCKTRKPEQNDEKDKLCLNMWLNESDLVWEKKDRNLYTAHEIAQVVPLVNKDKTYEKFLYLNKWILDYWPNSVEITNCKLQITNCNYDRNIFEKIAYKLQYLYMKNKITTEIVTPNKAIFHKNDWGKKVLTTLKAID